MRAGTPSRAFTADLGTPQGLTGPRTPQPSTGCGGGGVGGKQGKSRDSSSPAKPPSTSELQRQARPTGLTNPRRKSNLAKPGERRVPRVQSPRSCDSPRSAHFPVSLRRLPLPPGPNNMLQIASGRGRGARSGQKRMRIDATRRELVKIGAELQRAERGGRSSVHCACVRRPFPGPTHAARRGDARAARGRGGAVPGRASALLPPPLHPDSPSPYLPHTGPRQSEGSFVSQLRVGSARPGPASGQMPRAAAADAADSAGGGVGGGRPAPGR